MISNTALTLLIFSLLNYCFAQKLSFKNGTFTILQITDLHYGDTEEGDDNNVKITEDLIESVKPDVVIVTGDIISGYANDGKPDFQKNIWKKFTAPFIKNKVYYAFVLGNHDAYDGNLKPEALIELEKASEYSLFKHSLGKGFPAFTYYLPVHSSIKEDSISAMFWIMNTNANGCRGDLRTWGCMEDKDVKWYRKTSKKMNKYHGKDVHNLAFFHIAIPEYLNLFNEGFFYGTKGDRIGCPTTNTGAFKAFKEGNIQATFVGHDHNNDFGGWHDGIELVYGRKTGFGGYGPDAGLERGGRVITLIELPQEDGSIKVLRDHYVALPNGEVSCVNSWFENELQRDQMLIQESCPVLKDSVNLQIQYIMFICSFVYCLLF